MSGANWVPAPPPQRYYGKMEGYADSDRRQRENAMRKREPNPYPVFDANGVPTAAASASGAMRPPPGFPPSGSSRQEHQYAWE